MIERYIRASLKEFKAYIPEPDLYDVKLDANENPYNHSPEFMQEIREEINDKMLLRYPDTNSTELVQAIANYWKVNNTNVVCGVGSDQLIDVITKILLEEGDVALVPVPSFSMYQLSITLNHGKAVEYILDEEYNYNVKDMIRAYKQNNPKFMIVCCPNNPTGNVLTNNQLEELLQEVKCPLIIDEAYAEFREETAIELLPKYDNLIILRTFSKAYGLAGARIGYAIASEEIISTLRAFVPPYNINAFTQMVATKTINQTEDYSKYVPILKANKQKLIEELEKKSAVERVYPSEANFILVKFRRMGVSDILKQESVLIRDFSKNSLMQGCVRITIGTEEQNKRLLKAIDKL